MNKQKIPFSKLQQKPLWESNSGFTDVRNTSALFATQRNRNKIGTFTGV